MPDREWINSAMDFFSDAIDEGDIDHAKIIIADALDLGYLKEAQLMTRVIREQI